MRTPIMIVFLAACFGHAAARDFYIAPGGDDRAAGTEESPFASLIPAQKVIAAGDRVIFRGGVYKPSSEQSMGERSSIYSCAYILDKDGVEGKPITYMAYPGEQPIFDMSDYRPEGKRVSVFYVSGSWLHIKGLEVIGTQVTISDGSNTQSECFSNRGGSHNVYEDLKMHDGSAIGWYLVKGGNNLVLNCDAWCNYDKANGGGNVDGFGCHPSKGDTGNVLRGCRSWWNSDDGFDLIHSAESVWIDNCWAFYNGYQPNTFKSAADGNGIKAGGYGMSENSKIPETIPMHRVTNCLAYYNKSAGLYANHHLGGIEWVNNTGVHNRWNYNMVNRQSAEDAVDVSGYGHFLAHNVSFDPRDKDYYNMDFAKCTLINNSFGPKELTLTTDDFESLDGEPLTSPRQADGTLPDILFVRPKSTSALYSSKMGYSFQAPTMQEIIDAENRETQWLMAPTIVVEGDTAWIEGPDAEKVNAIYANDIKLKISRGKADFSAIEGSEILLKATLSSGVIMIKNIKR